MKWKNPLPSYHKLINVDFDPTIKEWHVFCFCFFFYLTILELLLSNWLIEKIKVDQLAAEMIRYEDSCYHQNYLETEYKLKKTVFMSIFRCMKTNLLIKINVLVLFLSIYCGYKMVLYISKTWVALPQTTFTNNSQLIKLYNKNNK